eukprot:1169316-Pyramimonas_sp.AAC.1
MEGAGAGGRCTDPRAPFSGRGRILAGGRGSEGVDARSRAPRRQGPHGPPRSGMPGFAVGGLSPIHRRCSA